MLLLMTLAAAIAGGLFAQWIKLPGGMIVGAMAATAAASLSLGEVALPPAVRMVIFVGVGMMIGMLVTRETLRALPSTAVQALVSGVLLIGCGILVTLLLRFLHMAPEGDVLATSPGALSVLSAAAAEKGLDAPTVALFHVVRIVLILLTLPLLVKLLPPRTPQTQERLGPGNAAVPGPAAASGGASGAGAGRPRWRHSFQVVLTAVAAAAGGLAALRSGISGALVFGTTLGAGSVTLAFSRPVACPVGIRRGVHVGVGWMIGTLVTFHTLTACAPRCCSSCSLDGFL